MESLESLNKYVETLVKAYPSPMTQSELADKSSVTKSAISKIRGRLLDLCDMRVVAFERKLVLKADFETFAKIFHLYLLQSRTEEFFQSKYAKSVLSGLQIYEKLSQSLKRFSFSKYFNEQDIDWAINLILQNVSSFQIQKDTFSIIASAIGSEVENENISEIIPYIQLATKLLTSFEITFKNEDELKRTLLLRDKVYYFIKENIGKILEEFEIIKELEDPEEKKRRSELLSIIVMHYVDKASKQVTEHIQQQARSKGIPFLAEYNRIGAFYKILGAGGLEGKSTCQPGS